MQTKIANCKSAIPFAAAWRQLPRNRSNAIHLTTPAERRVLQVALGQKLHKLTRDATIGCGPTVEVGNVFLRHLSMVRRLVAAHEPTPTANAAAQKYDT